MSILALALNRDNEKGNLQSHRFPARHISECEEEDLGEVKHSLLEC